MGGENLILISMLSFLASRFRFTLVADATLLRFVLFQWFLVSCFTCAGFDFLVSSLPSDCCFEPREKLEASPPQISS